MLQFNNAYNLINKKQIEYLKKHCFEITTNYAKTISNKIKTI